MKQTHPLGEPGRSPARQRTGWAALPEALAISLFILALFYYWFGLANRYIVFLYGHAATNIPTTQPFDALTSSRYPMAGLVAAGAVMALYTGAHGLAGRVAARRGKTYAPPPWQRVWLLCIPFLAIGIPAITMTVNAPTLPPGLAAATTGATLLGLAVALMPGRWAAGRPGSLLWLAADGLGLVPMLLLLRAVELPGRGLSVSPATAWLVAAATVVVGVIWLAAMGFLRRRRGAGYPRARELFLAGVGLSYLLLPLLHYLMAGPPGFRYISTANNFFATNPGLQAAVFLLAAGLAWAATAARRRTRPAAPGELPLSGAKAG